MSDYRDPREHKGDQVDDFLKKIAMLESSGGKNTNHKTVDSGVQAGETAYGDYGLMPNTVEELANRYPSDVYPKDADKQDLMEKMQADPNFEKNMAQTMSSYLLQKRGLTPEEAAAAYFEGHNLPKNQLDKMQNIQYVRKFKVLSR